MGDPLAASDTEPRAEAATVFRVVLRINVHTGMEPEFERVWEQIAGVIACNPLILGQSLMRSSESRGTYYVTSDWPDEAAFRDFELSEAHVEHRRRLQPFRRDGWMATTEVVCQM